ncbi:hypothetical protein ACTJJB_16000 [Chitinophaga sp. 22536]|uniref:hypothetical protein n=1 Tax=unclassified Chitinophaga TaxID=2619133 RepID=UPI003F8571CF
MENFAIPLLPSIAINDTLNFYKALGAIITYQQKAPNNYIGLKIKDIEIHFFGLKQIKLETNFSTCFLRVNDIDTFYNNCRTGLKALYGKIPLKGIPRINQLKDMPAYGARQFVIVDPSGNYIRIGQPIAKKDSLLFEENGKRPASGTALSKAYELADRLANGKEDAAAAIRTIEKALKDDAGDEPDITFKLMVLKMSIAQRSEDLKTAKQLHQTLKKQLSKMQDLHAIKDDIHIFESMSAELGLS